MNAYGLFYFKKQTQQFLLSFFLYKKRRNIMKNDPEVEHANQVSVIDYANATGIELKKVSNDCYKGIKHDSLVITPSRNAWYWNSRSKGGYGALSFVKDYVLSDDTHNDRAKFVRALKIVSKYNLPVANNLKKPFSRRFNTSKAVQRFNPESLNLTDDFENAYEYLTEKRKIDPRLVNQLQRKGFIAQDQKKNAVFIKRNPLNNQIIGGSLQGTIINFAKFKKRGTFKGIVHNSRPNSAWYFDLCQTGQVPHNIMIFEAPIDAMSYCTYQAEHGQFIRDTRYIALDGLKKTTALNYIAVTQKQLASKREKLRSINLAVDNDTAGNRFYEDMKHAQVAAIEDQAEQLAPRRADEKVDFAKELAETKFRIDNKINEKNEILTTAPNFSRVLPNNHCKDWNDTLVADEPATMTYEDNYDKVSDISIKKYMKNNDISSTKNPLEAIYALRDGTMISGNFAYGVRSDDHRIITGLIKEGENFNRSYKDQNKFWEQLQAKTSMIMLVPETKSALKAEGQSLTPMQKKIVEGSGYKIENYIKLPGINKTHKKNIIKSGNSRAAYQQSLDETVGLEL